MCSGKKRFLALGAALLLFLSACSAPGETKEKTILSPEEMGQSANVNTYETVLRDVSAQCELTLRVSYTKRIWLFAPDDGVYLEEINTQYGKLIPEGETLAVFRYKPRELEIREAEYALEREEEDHRERLKEMEKTIRNSWGTQYELARLYYDREVYTHEQKAGKLRKDLEEKLASREPVYLKAPCDCYIRSVSPIDREKELTETTEVMQISPADSLALTGTDLSGDFRYGDTVQVETEEETVRCRVISTPTLRHDYEDQTVWLLPEKAPEKEWSNFIKVNMDTLMMSDVIAVPRNAVYNEDDSCYVMILVDGVIHKRYITVGPLMKRDNSIVVLSGLEPGQQVIIK